MESIKVIEITKKWIDQFIIQHNICPFAKAPYEADALFFQVSETTELESVVEELILALLMINDKSEESLSNAFFILDRNFTFDDLLDIAAIVESIVQNDEFTDIPSDKFQFVVFHPEFQYDDTPYDDPTNMTNRSPFPMLHILRVEEVHRAIQSIKDYRVIADKNNKFLRFISQKKKD